MWGSVRGGGGGGVSGVGGVGKYAEAKGAYEMMGGYQRPRKLTQVRRGIPIILTLQYYIII